MCRVFWFFSLFINVYYLHGRIIRLVNYNIGAVWCCYYNNEGVKIDNEIRYGF